MQNEQKPQQAQHSASLTRKPWRNRLHSYLADLTVDRNFGEARGYCLCMDAKLALRIEHIKGELVLLQNEEKWLHSIMKLPHTSPYYRKDAGIRLAEATRKMLGAARELRGLGNQQ
jgi:hypothetical protein